jgi:hypothetical protein
MAMGVVCSITAPPSAELTAIVLVTLITAAAGLADMGATS